MSSPVSLLPSALSALFAEVVLYGSLTLADRYGLLAALMDEELTEEDRAAIDRLLHRIRQGKIKVVDELSILLHELEKKAAEKP